MCSFSDLIMFSLRIVISGCSVVDGGAWWLVTGLVIGHLVCVLCHSSHCVVVHHFRMSCDKAELTHFCQLNVARVTPDLAKIETYKTILILHPTKHRRNTIKTRV